MNKISAYAMRQVLGYLDEGYAALRVQAAETHGATFESHGAWRIRCAKELLLEAALADVEVEA